MGMCDDSDFAGSIDDYTDDLSEQALYKAVWKFPDGFDPEKYKKMKKMGLPEHVIKHKIVSDGFKDQEDLLFDIVILGKDPPKPKASKKKKTKNKKKLVRAPSEPFRPCPQPTKKMKAFYWEKLTYKDIKDAPYWQEVPDDITFNVNQFEDMFSRLPPKVSIKKTTQKKIETAVLYPAKRVENVTIGLSKYRKMKDEHIRTCILAFDEETFNVEDVHALIGLAPDPEEVAIIQSFD